MGIFDDVVDSVESAANSVVSAVESGAHTVVSTVEHAVGTAVDGAAHVTGDALHAVGLNGAAQAVDGWGDHVADSLGDQVAEMQLGQTTDPTQLVHGDVSAVNATVGHLRQFAAAFGDTARGLSGIDTSHWTGSAADKFRSVYQPHTKLWSTAQEACADAATALSTYAGTVTSSQHQAQQAINLYQQGVRATQQAQSAYNTQVGAYNSAADSYNAAIAAGDDPGSPPTKPGPFTDPGAALRQQAQQLLDQARQQRDAAAAEAIQAVNTATALAPATPSALGQLSADVSDTVEGLNTGLTHVVGGVVKGTAGIVDFVRGLNPLDPYNVTHPAEYVDGLSTTAAGLVHMSLHPTQLASALVGSGWGSDPFEAFGKLVPNIALAAVTDGAGTAADVGERVVVGVGEDATADVAENAVRAGEDDATAVRDEAGNPIETTRDPADTPCLDDPVDVTTGSVLLPQVDVDLPGALPLVLARTHLSSYRLGGWFGRTWASTMDMRVVVDGTGVIFVGADGVRLFYPLPGVDAPVLPAEGARWPLAMTADGGYTVNDPRGGRTFHFPRRIAGRRPIGAITDRAGNRIAFHYDDDGAPAEIRHDGGYRIRVTVADDRITALHLVGEPDVELRRYGYTDGNLTEVADSEGRPLQLAYDVAGRLVEWVDRNDVRYGYRYDDYGRCVHTEGPNGVLCGSFAYHPDERLTVHTDTLGAVTRFEYDERLRVVAETDPLGNTSRSEYHRYGWLIARTDALGRTTRYEYDDLGNPTAVSRADGTRALCEYTSDGQPAVVVEPDGAVWRFSYDERGNRVETTDPLGAVTRYAFTEHGHVAAITDALGNNTSVRTDLAGLPVAVIDPGGAVTRYVRDGFGRVVEQVDPAGGSTGFGWTVDGRPAWRRTPDGSTEFWHHDGEGNLVEHVDQLGRSTRHEYTYFDVPAARTAPDGTRLEYNYDHRLRLVSVTNQRGLVWRCGYDPAGRLLAETDFNGGTTRYGYDAAGQLISRTNASGDAVTFGRDSLGRVVEQRAGDEVTRYGYDPAGRLVRATNAESELLIQRDAVGRVLAESVDGRTLRNRYDAAGRRVERVTPSGVRSGWEYDSSGRPVRVRAAGHTIAFRHDQAGREVERRLDDVFGLVQTWDDGHRLTSQTLMGGQHPIGLPLSMLQRRAYRYRSDGRLAAVVDHLAGTRRLDLDDVGRITAVRTARGQENYRYDAAGNVTHAGWPVADQSEVERDRIGGRDYAGALITRAGTIRYQHDSAGRMVLRIHRRLSAKDLVWRYTWDAADRLVGVATPDGTRWRYRYDPLGRRVAKQRLAPDSVTVVEQIDFTWDGSQLVEQDHDTTHITTWDYAPGEHRPVVQVETTGGALDSSGVRQDWFDQRFYAIVTDLIGTPTELVDTRGALAWHQHATVWGAASSRAADGGAATPLRFPGQYFDAETGLHYNYHRYYDPTTARYTSVDPLGLAPAPNPYAYVENPTKWIDPLGLMKCDTANALNDWQSQRYQFGNQQLLLDKSDMAHILERHSPEFWDGSVKPTQTFFDQGTSIGSIQDNISSVLGQNRDAIISNPSNSVYQVTGTVNGRDYVLGINRGHVAQFYPR
ncbi:MAG TPA: RHS repeat-associated core domain-containing protein [Pseudonocardiaceae bacterium]|jgi:RHS repeat-associated protein|nr:RHS repeat-associated core domain-containing protein [Pseudonocardiaceae bacterium]